MGGIKEKGELSNEFNHPVENEIKQERLELGFQSLDFCDQALDHELIGNQEDGLAKKLSEMAVEGLIGGDEGSDELVLAIGKEGGFDKGGNFRGGIGGENDQGGLGGFRDGDELGGELRGNENRVGVRDLEGFINNEAKLEERKSEKLGGREGKEGDFREIKEGGEGNEESECSEIGNEGGDRDIKDEAKIEERNTEKGSAVEENEGGTEIKNEGSDHDLKGIKDEVIEQRDPEKHSLVEGSEGDCKEMKDGGNNKEGSHWGESKDTEEMKKRADKGKAVIEDYEDDWGETWDIEDYEDGWGENWDGGAVRAEANQEQQWFDNYENERDTYDKGPHWYGNTEKDSGDSNAGNFGRRHRPIRPDAEDCSFYMRTGTCRFGSNCKFNHPLKRKNQAARDTFQQMEEIYDKPGQTECKYHLSPGGCKHGKACRYSHGKGKAAVTPNLELNYIGLPIRVGEKECSFYMKTGSCKYGEKCRFHHPEPTAVGGGDTTSPMIYPPTLFAPENEEWNGYLVFLNSSDNLWKIRLQV